MHPRTRHACVKRQVVALRLACTCETHVVLELPSKEDGKDGLRSLRSQNGKNRVSTIVKSFLLAERRKRRKKNVTIYIFSSQRRVTIFYFTAHLANGNRSSCFTQNSHVFVAKCRVRLLSLIACTLVHLIRESDRGCGKRK